MHLTRSTALLFLYLYNMFNPVVYGHIEIPEEIRDRKFKYSIKLLDTSFMDMPAVTIAEIHINNTAAGLKQSILPFKIAAEKPIDPSHEITLAVHVDMDNDGQISANDYIQKQSYPAIVNGKPGKNLHIELMKI